jgi:hypothetical protein
VSDRYLLAYYATKKCGSTLNQFTKKFLEQVSFGQKLQSPRMHKENVQNETEIFIFDGERIIKLILF